MPVIKTSLYFIFLILLTTACPAQRNTSLDPKDFEKAIGDSNIQLLDVRTITEYQAGHLKNALLADWTNTSQFKERVAYLDKTKPIYTYCLSGVRSKQAAEWMEKNGFTVIYKLDGGIAVWKKAALPVEGQQAIKQISMVQYLSGIPVDKTVLVNIGAAWCPPCKTMSVIIDSLINSEKPVFRIIKIDGSEQAELTKELNIETLPTFIIYKLGKEIWRKQGVVSGQELAKQLE